MKFQLCASTQNSRICVQVCRSVRLPVRGTTVAISPRMSSPPSRDHSHARLCRGAGSGLLEEARPASGDPAACGELVEFSWTSACGELVEFSWTSACGELVEFSWTSACGGGVEDV